VLPLWAAQGPVLLGLVCSLLKSALDSAVRRDEAPVAGCELAGEVEPMALELRQHLGMRMEQKLKLTPQMIQSLDILQLPQMALEERLMHEVETNPVLDIADAHEVDQTDDGDGDGDGEGVAEVGADSADVGSVYDNELREEWDHEGFNDLLKARREAARQSDDDAPDKMRAIDATAGPPPSLADHLLDQLRFFDIPERVRECLPDLSWALDRRGYLTIGLDELFDEEHLDAAEQAWEHIRRCDPAGIGARDLVDCLQLQLQREPGDNSFEMILIRDHLQDVLRNRLPVIADKLGVDVDRVQEGVEVIAELDPQPGLPYADSVNQFVMPDVLAEYDEDDEWVVSIPDSHLPKVEINEAYYQLYDGEAVDQREKGYLREKLTNARSLLDALSHRKRTLLKIATEIVKHQRLFLEQGPEQLRPLMRQDIADRIGSSVSTVSRAVKDKYIQTPVGILPLSQFFSGGIATQDGSEAESSRSVKLKVKAMIEREDPKKPLSDQAIADVLAKEGLDISRRTVTKYRIAMAIPSTRQRRRFVG